MKKLVMSELLGNQALTKFSSIRSGELRRFLSVLHKASERDETVNITQELIKLTNNIISMMMLNMRCSGTESDADEARLVIQRGSLELLMFLTLYGFAKTWTCRVLERGLRRFIGGMIRCLKRL